LSGAKNTITSVKASLPIVNAEAGFTEIKAGDKPSAIEGGAYRKLRDARSEKRYAGKKEKRAREKADEAAAAKK
jgi:large subunit ribosomal protein L13e